MSASPDRQEIRGAYGNVIYPPTPEERKGKEIIKIVQASTAYDTFRVEVKDTSSPQEIARAVHEELSQPGHPVGRNLWLVTITDELVIDREERPDGTHMLHTRELEGGVNVFIDCQILTAAEMKEVIRRWRGNFSRHEMSTELGNIDDTAKYGVSSKQRQYYRFREGIDEVFLTKPEAELAIP